MVPMIARMGTVAVVAVLFGACGPLVVDVAARSAEAAVEGAADRAVNGPPEDSREYKQAALEKRCTAARQQQGELWAPSPECRDLAERMTLHEAEVAKEQREQTQREQTERERDGEQVVRAQSIHDDSISLRADPGSHEACRLRRSRLLKEAQRIEDLGMRGKALSGIPDCGAP